MRKTKMNDSNKKEDSWIRKLPTIIVILAVLIFMIVAFSNHNQFKNWKSEKSELTEKVKQTGTQLDLLRAENGSLQDVTKKVEIMEQQAAEMTAAHQKLIEEKNITDSALSKLRQELRDLNGQVSATKTDVAELTKESETLNSANQRLRSEILNKKGVLDSIEFLQRQKPVLEQNIQDLKTRNDLAAKANIEQQAKHVTLQKKIKEGEVSIQAQNEGLTALSNELSELKETVKELSEQKEKLVMLEDQQKRLEYLEYLQLQKESMETSINNLLEKGRMLEEKNLKLQQKIRGHNTNF
jgi:chromosome segregation ATPase